MELSVVGLGKLGSPLAAVLAGKGHQVIGVDVNAEYVRLLAAGKAPVQEPQLQELIDKSRARLKVTASCEDAVLGSELTFVIVPTPSDKNGVFTNKYVIESVQEIGKALRKKAGYHVVNITSTVMPGSTGGEIKEVLERSSGRRVGIDVGLCYNPEFIALGSVIRDMLNPDFILLGESDAKAGDVLESVYRTSCDNNPPVRRMNLVNAEIAKISINTYVTTKISYANMLAEICERLPGADVNVVTAAVGLDSRIGTKYLKGAIGYGGPCFPRDNVAFAALAHSIGARADLAEATDRLNRYQIDRLVAIVKSTVATGGCVGVLGLSYKPDTPVIEQSQGIALAATFLKDGYKVVVYDPMAMEAARAVLGGKAVTAETAEACVRRADVVVIMTPWPEFGRLSAAAFAKVGRKMVVVDCWRILPGGIEAVAKLRYVGAGSYPVADEPALPRAARE
jgi:UDPglucose 6-dehydrogenase